MAKFKYKKTPYCKDIMDNIKASNKTVIVKKGSSLGLSFSNVCNISGLKIRGKSILADICNNKI